MEQEQLPFIDSEKLGAVFLLPIAPDHDVCARNFPGRPGRAAQRAREATLDLLILL